MFKTKWLSLDMFHTKIIDLFQNNNIEEISNRGRDYVQKNFTWDKVTEQFLNEMNSVKNLFET